MDYKEYKQMVIDSEKGSLTKYPKILHAIMGMNGEAGECVDILKKHMFQGHEFDENHFLNELGDVCWYTMLLMIELGTELENIFEYKGQLIDTDWAEEIPDKGLYYVLNLNKNCGSIVETCYNCSNLSRFTSLKVLRSIFYNIIMTANVFDKTLEDIFDINHEKIQKRYPEGFSLKLSTNRSDNL